MSKIRYLKFRLLLVCIFIAISATASLAVGPYVGVNGGVSFFHDSDTTNLTVVVPNTRSAVAATTASYNPGFVFNVAGGYNFDGIRVEGEFGYQHAGFNEINTTAGTFKFNDKDATVMSYMFNGYYDIKTYSKFTPFLGAGIGLLNGIVDFPNSSYDDVVWGYQFTAGISYSIDKRLNLDLAYRFQGAGSDFSEDNVNFSYHSSNVLAGIRYNF